MKKTEFDFALDELCHNFLESKPDQLALVSGIGDLEVWLEYFRSELNGFGERNEL